MRWASKMVAGIWRFFTAPWRGVVKVARTLVNLTARQMRAIFSLAMLGGIVVLSAQNIIYVQFAKQSIGLGPQYTLWFGLLVAQIKFNSWLIAGFSAIMGMIVFGADYLHARYGSAEIGLGKGKPPRDPAIAQSELPSTSEPELGE